MNQTAEAARVALVTGAGGAVGAAVTARFQREGWRLALVVHGDESRAELEARHPDALVLQADLRDEGEARQAVRAAEEALGGVDALLNLAGGFTTSPAAETGAADLERMFALNFTTAFNATRAALPGMVARGRGAVLGVGARAALQGGARTAPYAAAKAALAAYLKSLQAELGSAGLTFAVLHPMLAIDTPDNRRAMPKADPSGWLSAEAVAEAAYFLVTRPARGRALELELYA